MCRNGKSNHHGTNTFYKDKPIYRENEWVVGLLAQSSSEWAVWVMGMEQVMMEVGCVVLQKTKNSKCTQLSERGLQRDMLYTCVKKRRDFCA